MNTISSSREMLLVMLLYSIIATTLFAPIAQNAYLPNVGDYPNHIAAIVQANLAINQGQFPIRVAPLEHHSWGYALYQFYAPIPYTVTALLYRWLTPWNPYIAFKIMMGIALMLGGTFFYRLVSWLFESKPIALLSGAVYLLAPYYIIIIDNWGGFTETIALGIVPIALYYTLRCCLEENDRLIFLKTAMAWFFIATSHSITFVYSSLFIGLFLILLVLYRQCPWQKLIWVGAAYGYGCLLGLWFLAPLIDIGHLMEITTTLTAPGAYSNIVPLSALLTMKLINPTLVDNLYKPVVNPAFGWPILLSVGLCFYLIVKKEIVKQPRISKLPHVLLILFALAFFLIWSPLNVWPLLPSFFSIVQYCWRLLGQTLWIGALLFACALYQLFGNRMDARHVIVGLLCLGISLGSWIPMLTRYPTSIEELVKHPLLGFSRSDYMVAANNVPVILNETGLENLIDKENHLKIGSFSIIPTVLLTTYSHLTLVIKGHVLKKNLGQNKTLRLEIDHREIKRFQLKPGYFQWKIALSPFAKVAKAPTFQLQFKTDATIPLSIEKLALTQFDPSLNVMGVNKVDTYCQHRGVDTFCQVPVSSGINLLELPLLYYPGMSAITLNGKTIDYKPILYRDFVLTAVKPEAGKMNNIHARFVGYAWANKISLLAWICLILGFLW